MLSPWPDYSGVCCAIKDCSRHFLGIQPLNQRGGNKWLRERTVAKTGMSTMHLSFLVSILFSSENNGCKVVRSQMHIQRLVRLLPWVFSLCVCAGAFLMPWTCYVYSCMCTLSGYSQDGEDTHPPLCAWRLFDLNCADGSQPTGCQLGGGVMQTCCQGLVRNTLWWFKELRVRIDSPAMGKWLWRGAKERKRPAKGVKDIYKGERRQGGKRDNWSDRLRMV